MLFIECPAASRRNACYVLQFNATASTRLFEEGSHCLSFCAHAPAIDYDPVKAQALNGNVTTISVQITFSGRIRPSRLSAWLRLRSVPQHHVGGSDGTSHRRTR
ncbi:uncharacterized protein PHALS_10304 [Plasmopara halstedii]|uniref:Uncharacterized protein n=1 Tax=Plasmopara halstedii TaxID=4781 RepID=A0A0P1AG15_PLAHL|nr:uncharacterized protein PHALS_10304 [Plasmopara halstedii]CEG40084.1 hypothetical protein PHALS_10304 [Plasmopara halstedii]|eukprot:XP_024576453.1 hypothetical protein PHALS_10304 [Plasmopara halstedii]